jgi:hypothetical protein
MTNERGKADENVPASKTPPLTRLTLWGGHRNPTYIHAYQRDSRQRFFACAMVVIGIISTLSVLTFAVLRAVPR